MRLYVHSYEASKKIGMSSFMSDEFHEINDLLPSEHYRVLAFDSIQILDHVNNFFTFITHQNYSVSKVRRFVRGDSV